MPRVADTPSPRADRPAAERAATPPRAPGSSHTSPRTPRESGGALAVATVVIGVIAAALVGLLVGGGAAPLRFLDPGPVVRWGLPIVEGLGNVALATTLGAIMTMLYVLPRRSPAYERTANVGALAAASWTLLTVITAIGRYIVVVGATSSPEATTNNLEAYFLGTESGSGFIFTGLCAAVVTALLFAVRGQRMLLIPLCIVVAATYPMALRGHASATAAGHALAVASMGLHVIFAALWIGGLVCLILVRPLLTADALRTALERYSGIALVSFIVVAVSGVANAQIRVAGFEGLVTTPYGWLVLGKAGLLLVLGGFGAVMRTRAIKRITSASASRWFASIATLEILAMGLVSGLAAALAVTNPNIGITAAEDLSNPTPAQLLTGELLPPAFTPAAILTQWKFDITVTLLAAAMLGFYAAGVIRLKRRGDAWPVLRTVSWSLGVLLFFFIGNGFINAYQHALFSVHMLGHMALNMMVPVLLVPGAPVTLLLRAVHKRRDGSRGAREWVLWAVHTPYARFITNPLVAAVIFAISLLVFYYTPLFRWATIDHLGHLWMIAHFMISGYLFVQSLIGIDPVPYRAPYPIRMLTLLAVMAFHAFFGLSLMTNSQLLMADWFGSMGWPGRFDALEDQRAAGGIAWSVGEIPTVSLAIAVAVMWLRSDRKQQRQYDRRADRSGEAELEAYNARLRELAAKDAKRP